MATRVIHSFSATVGWLAVYADKDASGTPTTATEPLIGWAVVHTWDRPEGRHSGGLPTVTVEGVTAPESMGDPGLIEDADAFLGYCSVSENPQSEAWVAKARGHFGVGETPEAETPAPSELAPGTTPDEPVPTPTPTPAPTKPAAIPRQAPKGKTP